MKWSKRLFCKHDYQLVSRYQDIGYVTFMVSVQTARKSGQKSFRRGSSHESQGNGNDY